MEQETLTAQSAVQYGLSKYSEQGGRCFWFFFCVEALCLLAATSTTFHLLVLAQVITQLDSTPPESFVVTFMPTYLVIRSFAQVLVNKYLLMVVDGRVPSTDELLGFDLAFHLPQALKTMLAGMVYTIYSLVGSLVLVVPGLFALSTLRFYKFLVVDQDVDAIDGLRGSFELSGAFKGELVSLTVITAFIRLFGALLLGIGLVPANAVCGLAEAYAYRQIQLANRQQPAPYPGSLN